MTDSKGSYNDDFEPSLDQLPTVEQQRHFMRTAEWMPFEEYKAKIYEWHITRDHAEHNIKSDFFGAQSKANQLLREAAWMMAIEQRPTHMTEWTEEDQKELEEQLYNKLMFTVFESQDQETPWPADES